MKRAVRDIRCLSTAGAILLLTSLAGPTQMHADDNTWYKARSIIILGTWCSGECPIPATWCCIVLDGTK
jgi:hypothetical protein